MRDGMQMRTRLEELDISYREFLEWLTKKQPEWDE
jgi:hypothetical protein